MATSSAPLTWLIRLNAIAFGLTMISGTVEPALLGHRLFALVRDPSQRALWFGLITFGGLATATLTQPIIGAWLDARGRRGRFIVGGIGIALGGLFTIAFAPWLWLVGAGVVVTQLGVNIALAAWQPTLARDVPAERRGAASGARAALELAANAIGRVSAAELLSLAPQVGVASLMAATALPSAAVGISTAITLRALPHADQPTTARSQRGLGEALRRALVLRNAPSLFAWWFVARSTFWCGALASSAFLLFVATDVFEMSEAEAQRFVSRLIVALGATLGLVVLPAGWLTDRLGRTPVMIAAGALASVGAMLVVWERSLVMPAAMLIGAGSGLHLASSLALINDIVPKAEAARYLGIANIANTTGSALARAGGGVLISAVNALTQSQANGYIALYAVAAGLFALSTGAALWLRLRQQRASANRQPDEDDQ